jgi:acetyl esterase/lipase
MTFFISPAAVLNAFADRSGCTATRDIAYAEGARHGLDVYSPKPNGKPAAVVVFFYGGSWEEGDKAYYPFLGASLAAQGLVVVVPDYRVYPAVRFPAFLEDAALAVRWARDHAESFGGDPSRLILMGHSAGAHIAAMLTFDRQWLGNVALDPRRDVKGMIGLAGPYDFLPLTRSTLKAIFGPPENLAATQPINFVDGLAPPVFLATGIGDNTVKPGNSLRLAERIRAKQGSAEVATYRNVGHLTLIGAFAPPLRLLAPVRRDTVRFIDAVAGIKAAGGADRVIEERNGEQTA